jgi:hypothetical protein
LATQSIGAAYRILDSPAGEAVRDPFTELFQQDLRVGDAAVRVGHDVGMGEGSLGARRRKLVRSEQVASATPTTGTPAARAAAATLAGVMPRRVC